MNDFRFPTFEDHARAQRERERRKTPAERLAWLWEAKMLARTLAQATKIAPTDGGGGK